MRANDNKLDEGITSITMDEILKNFENEELFQGKITLLSDLLNARITLINNKYEILFTTDNSEEIIGYSFEDFKLLDTLGYIHPTDRAKVASILENFDKRGISKSVFYRIFKPSGELCWIRGVTKQILDVTNVQKGIILIETNLSNDLDNIQHRKSDDNQFEKLLETIKVPILFMRNNAIVWATKIWSGFFGYKLEDVRNQSVEMLFKSQDDYANFLLDCNQKLKLEGALTYHTELVAKNGKKSNIDIYAYTIEDNNLAKGILFFFLDVTEIEELMHLKDETINLYRSIVNNSDALVLRVENQKIIWNNKSVEETLLYDDDELVGKDLSILFQTKDACNKFLSDIRKKFLEKTNLLGEIQCIRKDRYPINLTIRAIPVSYQISNAFFLYLEPISELRQLVNDLRDEKSELEYYSDLLFHDVKNYCQDALSQIDLSLMKMDNTPDEAKQRQRKSRIDILRIAELINNMDKFFRIKRRGYELKSYDVYLAAEKAKTRITSKFDHRKIVIEHNLKPQNHYTIGNELLDDVFLNILDNIIMFNTDSEVQITMNVTSSEVHNDYWSVKFSSLKPLKGMEIEKLLSGRFSKTEGSVYGSGFGLTLAKSIIESLNGYIRYSDQTKEQKPAIVIEIPKTIVTD
jgi:PAS domain S-box-containing protein